MRWSSMAFVSTALGIALVVPVRSIADEGHAIETFKCRSENYGHHECRYRSSGEVTVHVKHQLSKTRCNLNENWGTFDGGVWVDSGCSAEFVVRRPPQEYSSHSYPSQRAAGSSDGGTWYSRLAGAAGDGAETQLRMHGFHQVDTFDSGRNSSGTVWYNTADRQCLQVITVNGRVDSAVDIHTHPKCTSHRAAESSDGGTWYSRLAGAAGDGAETQLRMHGFHLVDTFDSGRNSSGTVWYNTANRQCLQVITVKGRVDSAVDIHTHPRCRR